MNQVAKKSLGQHWLVDEQALENICDQANLLKTDTVLEIGPGHGALTRHLVNKVGSVTAVEYDEQLAKSLKNKVQSEILEVIYSDILKFDFSTLPYDYKIVANIPYYLTSHLFRIISENPNPPIQAVILIQKEVAERICAGPGDMSLLSVGVQLYFNAELGLVVPASSFDPPPKVDSQTVILTRHQKPILEIGDTKLFFRIVKAGFSARRKKLRSSISGGLAISKPQAEKLLEFAGIDPGLRAQNLSLNEWHALYNAYVKILA